jgi:hypothetical protein
MFGGESEKRIPVTVTMTDGRVLQGSVPCGPAGSLAIEINREGLFQAFKTSGGQVMFLAKANIAQVEEGDTVKEARIPTTPDGRDPYKVLRIAKGASSDTVRQAYLALARQYHPDHYVGEHYPDEIRDYATLMFQQITAAHQALKATLSEAA